VGASSSRFRINPQEAIHQLERWEGLSAGPGDDAIAWYQRALALLIEGGAIAQPRSARVTLGHQLSAAREPSLATIVEFGRQMHQANGPIEATFDGDVVARPEVIAAAAASTLELANGLFMAGGGLAPLCVRTRAAAERTFPGDAVLLLWTSDPLSPLGPGAFGVARQRTARGVEVDWEAGADHPLVDVRDYWIVARAMTGQ
jgi:hypothetical protein